LTDLDADQYRRLIEASPEGVVLVDARHSDRPVVFVNPGFEALTGYTAPELLGRNLRFLQGEDRDQKALQRLREFMGRGESCRVLLRNYRKDNSLFWNDLMVVPLRDGSGELSHFAGYARDAGDRRRLDLRHAGEPGPRVAPPVTATPRDDRLTGLFTLPYLEELLKRDWAIAQRERRCIAIFSIDIDALGLYNTTFGRAAGDSTIRRIAHCNSGCLRRASDASARVDGGSLVAYAPGLILEQAQHVGHVMAERVRELRIHHPRSTVLRYVSISVGVVAAVPEAGDNPADLLQSSRRQLDSAKKSGRNRAA
jgi:diguanylate cyclase (GGDEF)-like protein/PAS domain S-box-containing protein